MVLAILLTTSVQADPPGLPDSHETNGDAPGGGAPTGSGLDVFMFLAAVY